MKTKIWLYVKTIGLFLLLFTMKDIPLILLNIDVSKFSNESYYIYSFIMNIAYMLLLFAAYYETLKKDFKKTIKNISENIDMAIKYWLPGFLIMIISNFIIVFILNLGIADNESSIRSMVDITPLYMFFQISFYAPFTEELIFRKGIRDLIKNGFVFVLVSGFIFGALHVSGYVEKTIDWIHLIPYCSLGISFALLYYKSDNIFLSMIMHALHNSMALFLLFL